LLSQKSSCGIKEYICIYMLYTIPVLEDVKPPRMTLLESKLNAPTLIRVILDSMIF